MVTTHPECPYCRQPVADGAKRCKHCLTEIAYVSPPDHGGVCPVCKEQVHSDATKCQHCKVWIGPTKEFRFRFLSSTVRSVGASGDLRVDLGIATGGSVLLLDKGCSFGDIGGSLEVVCACVRECRTTDGVTTCGPWECIGPPGCLDLASAGPGAGSTSGIWREAADAGPAAHRSRRHRH